MTHSNVCRLCVEICEESKSLYDENDTGNALYEMTMKYFHPTIVDLNEAKHLREICLSCWRHMCDFNTFQCSVTVAQLKLLASKESVTKDEQTNDLVEMRMPKIEPIDVDNKETPQTEMVIKVEPEEQAIGLPLKEQSGDIGYTVKIPYKILLSATAGDNKIMCALPTLKELSSKSIGYDEDVPADKRCRIEPHYLKKDSPGVSTQAVPCTQESLSVEETSCKAYETPLLIKKLPSDDFAVGRAQTAATAQADLADDIYDNSTLKIDVTDNQENMHPPPSISPTPLKLRYEDSESEEDLPLEIVLATDLSPRKEVLVSENGASDTKHKAKTIDRLDDLLAKWLPQIKCGICPKTFPRLPLLEEHFRTDHNSEKFYILCCSRKLTCRPLIKQHLMLHQNPNAFQCHICGKVYPFKHYLAAHKNNVHSELIRSDCKICGESFLTQRTLRRHYNYVHNTDIPLDKTLETEVDSKTVNLLPQEVLQENGDNRPVYPCRYCGKKSLTKAAYRSHVWYNHVQKPKFQCKLCGRSFKNNHCWIQHQAVHTGNGAYLCAFCPKKFNTHFGITRHRNTEHPSKKNKRFYTIVNPLE